jgi:hypothetical protein
MLEIGDGSRKSSYQEIGEGDLTRAYERICVTTMEEAGSTPPSRPR